MFGVLGSTIFWALFFIISFVIGSILLKHIAPLSWETIKTGERPASKHWSNLKADMGSIIIAIICVYLFWPIILAGIILWFVLKLIVGPVLRKLILSSGSIIPDIEIKFDKKE